MDGGMDRIGNVATSLTQQTGSSTSSELSTNQLQQRISYASGRARLLFGQYRTGEANDPDTYVAAVAAVLSEYPMETIRHVTDPRTGIAGNPIPDPDTGRVWTGMPNPAEVRRQCEAHYGPVRRAQQRMRDDAAAVAERAKFGAPQKPAANATPKALCERFGISRIPPGWDAIDVTRQAHKHGANFAAYVESLFAPKQGAPSADGGAGSTTMTDDELTAHYGRREAAE